MRAADSGPNSTGVTRTAARSSTPGILLFSAAAVDRDGLFGLGPAETGPQRAHKLTDGVIACAQRLRRQDPGLG